MRLGHAWRAAALLLVAVPASADPFDDIVGAEMLRQHIPGVAVAVVQDGKMVRAQGYGLANVELNVPVTPATVFQSGSVGKQFTAMAVMMLVQEGKVKLDAPASTYLPQSPVSWKEVTVRRLLTHTAGIANYTTGFDLRRDYTEDQLFRYLAAAPLDFAPGEKWSYSNGGYVLLGILIHKVTGKFYGDFLRERVFQPLGMDTARVISESDIVPNRAAGYRLVNGRLKNQEWVSPTLNTTADGALYLTVLDMAKWDAALSGERLLKKSALEQLSTPVTLKNGKSVPYGFGWALGGRAGHRVMEHGGAWQGFVAYITRYLDDHVSVIVLTNLAGARPQEIVRKVAPLYAPVLKPASGVGSPSTAARAPAAAASGRPGRSRSGRGQPARPRRTVRCCNFVVRTSAGGPSGAGSTLTTLSRLRSTTIRATWASAACG